MRGTLIIGLVVVSLIIGILVIKNMGGGNASDVTQTEKIIEKAERAADQATQRVKDINKKVAGAE
jgi:hypothetical protein